MDDKEFIEVYKAIEKEAAKYKKIYGRRLRKEYGGSPDWLELTKYGFDAIKKELFGWCAIYRAKQAIRAKYDNWRNAGYYEPRSLTHKIRKGEYGLEYIENDIDSIKRFPIYGKSVITGYCRICNNPLFDVRSKTCSKKCRNRYNYIKN